MRFILGLLLKMLLIFIQVFYSIPLFIYIYYVYFIKEKNNTVNDKYKISDDLSKRLKNDEVVQKFLNPTVKDFLKHLVLMILLCILIVKLIKLIFWLEYV